MSKQYESWVAWLGRRCADAVCIVLGLWVLRWLGLIVVIEKIKWPVSQW